MNHVNSVKDYKTLGRDFTWEPPFGKINIIVGDEKGILEVWADNFKELPNALGKGIIPEKKRSV